MPTLTSAPPSPALRPYVRAYAQRKIDRADLPVVEVVSAQRSGGTATHASAASDSVLYWCGVRRGQALQIEWPQVDLNARLIRLEGEQTKNAGPRVVPLPAVLVNLLSAAEPRVGRVFSSTNLRTEWKRACAACGLGVREKIEGPNNTYHKDDGLIVHDLRRNAVRNLRRAGVSHNVMVKMSGHKRQKFSGGTTS